MLYQGLEGGKHLRLGQSPVLRGLMLTPKYHEWYDQQGDGGSPKGISLVATLAHCTQLPILWIWEEWFLGCGWDVGTTSKCYSADSVNWRAVDVTGFQKASRPATLHGNVVGMQKLCSRPAESKQFCWDPASVFFVALNLWECGLVSI